MDGLRGKLEQSRQDSDQRWLAAYEREEKKGKTVFWAEIVEETSRLPCLHVEFSIHFPDRALMEAISVALSRNADELLPPSAMREAGLYLRLWATYTLETELRCAAREALNEWNGIVEHLASAGVIYRIRTFTQDTPARTPTFEAIGAALSWNLDDAAGATVGSGETLYSRYKRVVQDRIVALDHAFGPSAATP